MDKETFGRVLGASGRGDAGEDAREVSGGLGDAARAGVAAEVGGGGGAVVTTPTRPVLRYHGGKWMLAPWIIEHFPVHRIYVEPFGGAASVLLQKAPAYSEVYNDLEGDVVNLFRVLQDPAQSVELRRLLYLTPFARDEFLRAYENPSGPVDRAHKMLARAFMGHGSASMTREHKTGFRANANKQGTTPAHDWASFPDHIPAIVERLRGVLIENRPAIQVIRQIDTPDTLFYCDPPYVFATRRGLRIENPDHRYKCEMTDADHRELAQVLHGVAGMVVVSGYPSALYDEDLYCAWNRIERPWIADGARPRIEVLWINPSCAEAIEKSRSQGKMFA